MLDALFRVLYPVLWLVAGIMVGYVLWGSPQAQARPIPPGTEDHMDAFIASGYCYTSSYGMMVGADLLSGCPDPDILDNLIAMFNKRMRVSKNHFENTMLVFTPYYMSGCGDTHVAVGCTWEVGDFVIMAVRSDEAWANTLGHEMGHTVLRRAGHPVRKDILHRKRRMRKCAERWYSDKPCISKKWKL